MNTNRIFFLILAFAVCLGAQSAFSDSSSRPNVLWIIAEDIEAD